MVGISYFFDLFCVGDDFNIILTCASILPSFGGANPAHKSQPWSVNGFFFYGTSKPRDLGNGDGSRPMKLPYGGLIHIHFQQLFILGGVLTHSHMGVSENSVPLNPMVLLIIIPMKNCYFIGNMNPTFSDKPIYGVLSSASLTTQQLFVHRWGFDS